jgi:hypothetical protein
VISSAIDGDGYVLAPRKEIGLASGERVIALLWTAALAAYDIKTEVRKAGRGFDVVSSGGDAARLAGLYFLYGSPLLEGDDRLKSHKLAEAMKLAAEGLSVSWEGLREIKGGAAADLIISVGGAAVKYNVYLRKNAIELNFQSKERSSVELAARLLRIVGVEAELERDSSRDVWRVYAYTDVLASASEELRKALAEIIKTARGNGSVDERRARRWLEKLERGVAAWEGKKFMVRLSGSGALEVRFRSTSRKSVEEVVREFKAMGLEEDKHFTVRWSGGEGPRLSSGRGGEAPRVGLHTRRRGAEAEGREVPQIPRSKG